MEDPGHRELPEGQVVTPGGMPIEPVDLHSLQRGEVLELDAESPEEVYEKEHPTPNHPTGRIVP